MDCDHFFVACFLLFWRQLPIQVSSFGFFLSPANWTGFSRGWQLCFVSFLKEQNFLFKRQLNIGVPLKKWVSIFTPRNRSLLKPPAMFAFPRLKITANVFLVKLGIDMSFLLMFGVREDKNVSQKNLSFFLIFMWFLSSVYETAATFFGVCQKRGDLRRWVRKASKALSIIQSIVSEDLESKKQAEKNRRGPKFENRQQIFFLPKKENL